MKIELLPEKVNVRMSLWVSGAVSIYDKELENYVGEYTVKIRYPFRKDFEVVIKVDDCFVDSIIDKIIAAYKYIYETDDLEECYHDIEDLWIEDITLDTETKIINLFVGS